MASQCCHRLLLPPLLQVQLEASEGTEMLAKQRAKLLTMSAEKKWTDKGTGTLTLRRASGADAANGRPYFVFTTDSGGLGGWG